MPNSAYYSTAKNAIDSLNTYASKVQKSVPAEVAGKAEVDTMNINIKKFVTASKEVPITVCPTSCLNVGSFYGECDNDYQHRVSNCACGMHAASGCHVKPFPSPHCACRLLCIACPAASLTAMAMLCPLPTDTLRLPTSCVCSDANMADVADQAVNTWKVNGLNSSLTHLHSILD
jgi:hypothetical protein